MISERRRSLKLMMAAAAILITLNLVVAMAVTGAFGSDENEQAVANNDLPPIVSVDAPAYSAAEDLLAAALPPSWRPTSAIEPGAVDLLQLGCGTDGSATAALAYHRPVQVRGSTVTAAVEVWPTGSGAAAIDRYRERSDGCWNDPVSVWSENQNVAGYPGVAARIQANGSGTQTLRWSIGDVTLSLTGSLSNENTAGAKAWTARAQTLLSPVCVDLHPGPTDNTRSPWRSPNAYKGLLTRILVSVDRPIISAHKPAKQPELDSLDVVEIPTAPQGVPFWPLELPNAIPAPVDPDRPKRPKFRRRVPYQIPDPVGPGCGWEFTASPVPEFTAAQSDQDRNSRVEAANRRLTRNAERWARDETTWREAKERYYALAAEYAQYAKRVAKVGESWQEIREDWSRYQQLRGQWQASISVNADWKLRRRTAEFEWQNNRCPIGSVPPTAVPSASATPSPTPTCLFNPPTILSETEPIVIPEPSKPRDPRPLQAR